MKPRKASTGIEVFCFFLSWLHNRYHCKRLPLQRWFLGSRPTLKEMIPRILFWWQGFFGELEHFFLPQEASTLTKKRFFYCKKNTHPWGPTSVDFCCKVVHLFFFFRVSFSGSGKNKTTRYQCELFKVSFCPRGLVFLRRCPNPI